ncbi:MAG TPA: DUF2079 domain-containing protein [Kineosporiaceae bacterium]|nr:DUF2079 domain-containing protein [Kineosporiaceae bacterium]
MTGEIAASAPARGAPRAADRLERRPQPARAGQNADDEPPSSVGPDPGFTRRQRWVLGAIAVTLFAAYTTYAFARHAKFETTGFDLGIFDQVIRAYSHFDAPTSPLKGIDYNILGDHFHPILVLLAPLYWIWDDPRMLLVAQAALFAISIVPVASFARRRLGGTAALWVAACYGAGWPLERAVHFDFHEIAFAVPLIALLIDAMDRRRDRIVIAASLILLLVREDMGSMVVLVGLLMALRRPVAGQRRRRDVLLGGALALLGLLGYWVATGVVIPALGPQGFTYWTFTALGPDPASALWTILTRPWRAVYLMFSPAVKAQTLLAIFLPTAFATLLSPYVLLSMPFLAERMLNDRPLLWQTNFHYTSVIAPILMMGAVDTVARLTRRFPAALGPRRVRLPLPGGSGRRRLSHLPVGLTAGWLVWCVAAVGIGLAVKSPNYPVSGLWSGRVWVRDARWHAVHDTLPMIPAGQCVEADNQIAPQLTTRDYVTRVTMSRGLATWVIVDMNQKETGWQAPAPAIAVDISLKNGYRIVSWEGPIVLLHKDRPIAPICRGLY